MYEGKEREQYWFLVGRGGSMKERDTDGQIAIKQVLNKLDRRA